MSQQDQPQENDKQKEEMHEASEGTHADMEETEQNPEREEQSDAHAMPESSEELRELVSELEQQVAGLQTEVSQEREKALRVAADAENAKRRAAIDVEKARNFALEKFASELLPVVDNLERALQTLDAENEAHKGVIEGIEMTQKSFLSTLEKFGIEAIDPQGQPFNPQHHEAMSMQESDEVPPNTVVAVLQKGYLLNGRLIRPAMVMVSKAAG